jgi:hypothetical protein
MVQEERAREGGMRLMTMQEENVKDGGVRMRMTMQ